MKLVQRHCQTEGDYWRVRNFLREVFLLNQGWEHSWHVARLDYWRWHYITNLSSSKSVEAGLVAWEREDGKLAGVLTGLGAAEVRLHVHPDYRSPALEGEMLAYAERSYCERVQDGRWYLVLPVYAQDVKRQEFVSGQGYEKVEGWGHHWYRDLDEPLPGAPRVTGCDIRSMGTLDEHPARSWASWRAFHAEEPDENYDGDWSWYQNIQAAPLYRRDLDIVAATPAGEIAAFCTLYYDDYTRSAVCVLVGTAAEHWRRGLGKAVILEGMRRLKKLGCKWVFATAHDLPADRLYGSVMQAHRVTDTWIKSWRT